MQVATNTHSEYEMLIAFQRQQWLRERISMLRLYVHCLSCLALVYRLLTTLPPTPPQKKKRKSFFYSFKRQMEDNTRPVARVVVCLSQENIAKRIYLLDSRISVLVARKNLCA